MHTPARSPDPLRAAMHVGALVLLSAALGLPVSAPAAPHADVGAMLQASAALKSALAGRKAVTQIALPGSTEGLEIRPEARVPLGPKDLSRRLAYAGQAYAPNTYVEIAALRVTRREITVALGAGGYDAKTLQMPAPGSPGYREWNLMGEIQRTRQGGSWYVMHPDGSVTIETPVVDKESRLRELEQSRLEATHQRELAEENARQTRRHAIARVSGTRLHLVFARDLTPADLTEARVRELLAPYLRFEEPAATPR
jgi:hypothetical protein